MGKRGIKPKRIIDEKWTANLAYAVGLISSDGYLSKDGLLIDLTSKDREQLKNFSKCLNINYKIGIKKNGNNKISYRIQFKNRFFYNFLLSIGLTPKKSLSIGKLKIPEKFFFDFLRGSFDGDGSFYSYWDKRWRSSYMFYIEFISASTKHIEWIRNKLTKKLKVVGHITKDDKKSTFQLKYAKKEAMEIIKKMYYNNNVICLSRKSKKIKLSIEIEKRQQKVYAQVEKR